MSGSSLDVDFKPYVFSLHLKNYLSPPQEKSISPFHNTADPYPSFSLTADRIRNQRLLRIRDQAHLLEPQPSCLG